MIDIAHAGHIDYDTFRTKIPKALNTSVRSIRHENKSISNFLVGLSIFVALTNLLCVILLTIFWEQIKMKRGIIEGLGIIITLSGIADIILRIKYTPPSPLIKLNYAFDGMAGIAAAFSLYGECFYSSSLFPSLQQCQLTMHLPY